MDEKTKAEFLKKRQDRLGGVVPTTTVPKPEPTPVAETKEGDKPVKPWQLRKSFHIWINPEDLEYLNQYMYWRGCSLGKKVTYSDAISEAVRMLRKHSSVELKPIPDWVPRPKKRAKKEKVKEIED